MHNMKYMEHKENLSIKTDLRYVRQGGGGLRLFVPVNNFSVMSGRSHRFLCITSPF